MKRGAAWAVTLLFLGVGGAQGQEDEPPGPPGDRRPRDEAAKMVDAYIISNLQESLGLSDDQFVKLLPLVKRLQSDRRDAAARRAQTMRQLRRLLASGRASEAQVLDLLKQVKAMESEEPDRLRRSVAAIDAVLTPLQQAKFRVLEMEVEFRIRELMGQIRRQGRPDARPRSPARPEGEPPP